MEDMPYRYTEIIRHTYIIEDVKYNGRQKSTTDDGLIVK